MKTNVKNLLVLVCRINGSTVDAVCVNASILIGAKMADQVKTDVELLKRDMELLAGLAEKFDIAIDRLSEVSQSVDKMLAIHENRLLFQERQAEIIHNRISDFKKDVMDEVKSLRSENQRQHAEVNDRLARLERWRWFVVGVAAAIGFIFAQMPVFTKLFN